MILDVIIIIILVLPMAVGMRKGFIYSCVHALSWFAAAAAGIFMSGAVSDALRGSFVGTGDRGRICQEDGQLRRFAGGRCRRDAGDHQGRAQSQRRKARLTSSSI